MDKIMSKDKEQLYVFGYGLALLIPFFIGLHLVKSYLHFWIFIGALLGGFTLVMFVITRAAKRPPVFNIWIWLLVLAVTVYAWMIVAGVGVLFFCGCANVIIGITVFKVERLFSVYSVWMRGAGLVSYLITGMILTVIFYSVFTIVGLFLRVLRKDLLGLNKPSNRETFWTRRTKKDFLKDDCLRQF